MQSRDNSSSLEIIQEKISSMSEYLRKFHYNITVIQAEELIAYFEGDAPSGDNTTLDIVLQSKWLLIHELVEINELKQQGFTISSDLLVSNPVEVFQAHLVATEWEFQLATKNDATEWIQKRLLDIRSWLEDPSLESELSYKCHELLKKYS